MLTRSPIRGTFVATLVLLALVASALLAGTARAAAPPVLIADVTPHTVTYPGSAVVSGQIDVPNAVLSLSTSPAGAGVWSPPSTVTAGPDGRFSFTVKPKVSTDYRLSFEATAEREAAQMDVSLRVRPRITTSFPASLWLGGTVLLRGAVAPAHAGSTVSILRFVSGVWQPLTTATLDADSRFALPWRPATYGFFRLRARLDAHEDHAVGLSTSELVIVNRPNAHHVPYKYAHYIVIVRHQYRLFYYEHGVLVRGFNVALGRPGYRTPLGYYRIYYKRKPAGGALGACAMFYRPEGGIAIHGTNEPWLLSRPIPRDFSHGCARMYNSQVLWLYERCAVGTFVHNLR